MREIKFRGKKINDNTMLFGDLNFIDGKVYIFPRDKEAPYNSPDWFEVDPETIGQMVGLADKNGDPIYEGDVLEWPHLNGYSPVEVYFNQKDLIFVGRPVHKDEKTESYIDSKSEILGNVHQDKHLLL